VSGMIALLTGSWVSYRHSGRCRVPWYLLTRFGITGITTKRTFQSIPKAYPLTTESLIPG